MHYVVIGDSSLGIAERKAGNNADNVHDGTITLDSAAAQSSEIPNVNPSTNPNSDISTSFSNRNQPGKDNILESEKARNDFDHSGSVVVGKVDEGEEGDSLDHHKAGTESGNNDKVRK